MKTLTFQIQIDSPASHVYEQMLGLRDKQSYERWTALFDPSSTYEGDWAKGSKIYFLSKDQEGKKHGMVAIVKENIPNEYVSVSHIGFIDGDQEVQIESEDPNWGEMLENYTFTEQNGTTTVDVRVDADDKYVDYFNTAWVLALEKLKADCEK